MDYHGETNDISGFKPFSASFQTRRRLCKFFSDSINKLDSHERHISCSSQKSTGFTLNGSLKVNERTMTKLGNYLKTEVINLKKKQLPNAITREDSIGCPVLPNLCRVG